MMNNRLDAYCKGKEENPSSDVMWLESSTAECRSPEFLGLGQSLSLLLPVHRGRRVLRERHYMCSLNTVAFFTLSS